MKREARDNRPNIKPVKRLILEEGDVKRRLIVVIILVVVAASFFAYGIYGLVNRRSGWTNIEPVWSADLACSDEFVLQYMLGESNKSGTAEYKQLSALFKSNLEDCAKLYDAVNLYDGITNIACINASPNEELELDPRLYEALLLFDKQASRALFYAPIYRYYDWLFACTTDEEAAGFDRVTDAETAALFKQALVFIQDDGAVCLEFLGENKIKLCVSKAYMDFAKQNELPYFVDFGWMKNAFIVDEIAKAMLEANLTNGMISSYDGFTRNLYGGEQSFSLNIFDFSKDLQIGAGKGTVIPAARMDYTGARSIVTYRSFFMNSPDERRYYVFEDGRTIGPYISPDTGIFEASCPYLTAYATDAACADILLQTLPLYTDDQVDTAEAVRLREAGIYTIYCQNKKIFYSEQGVTLMDLYKDENLEYKASQID